MGMEKLRGKLTILKKTKALKPPVASKLKTLAKTCNFSKTSKTNYLIARKLVLVHFLERKKQRKETLIFIEHLQLCTKIKTFQKNLTSRA